jgi:hypothetical protein
VEQDIKEDLGFCQAKHGLKKDEMPGAADRNEFGQALNNPQKDGLKEGNVESPIPSSCALRQVQGGQLIRVRL